MVIDIPSKILFGNYTMSPFDPAGRGFSSKDVKAAPVYLRNMYKHIICQNIPHRIDNLMEKEYSNHTEAEKIDKQMTAGCTHGENKCHRRRREYWTVEIHKIRRELVIWCTFKYRKKRKLENTPLINRAQTIGIPITKEMEMIEIEAAILKIWTRIKVLHADARELRDQHLLDCLHIARELSQEQKASIIQHV